MVIIKSSFGGYYDSDKLFCLNSSLQTDLYLHFLKYNMLCTYMNLWSNKTFFIIIVIVIMTKHDNFCRSEFQFGLKEGVSTTQYAHVVNETINYYNFNIN